MADFIARPISDISVDQGWLDGNGTPYPDMDNDAYAKESDASNDLYMEIDQDSAGSGIGVPWEGDGHMNLGLAEPDLGGGAMATTIQIHCVLQEDGSPQDVNITLYDASDNALATGTFTALNSGFAANSVEVDMPSTKNQAAIVGWYVSLIPTSVTPASILYISDIWVSGSFSGGGGGASDNHGAVAFF